MVFDMDGVLIDSHPAHRTSWREFLELEGLKVTDQELSFILDGRTRAEILKHFLGDLPEQELQKCGQRKDDIFRCIEREIEPVPGVIDFLREIERQGIIRAVATSASEIRTFSTIERLGLGGFFDAVITASDAAAGKPDPLVYRMACERIRLNPSEGLAFDDAPAGVQSATKAGMRCIGVASNGLSRQLVEAGAEAVIPDFREPELRLVLEERLRPKGDLRSGSSNRSRPKAPVTDNKIA
jgi:beta-phosphoglucomutase